MKNFEGYSIIRTINSLYLISIGNYKILLCACNKLINEQKNGILLVNFLDLKNLQFNYSFYDTNNFEVFCFCQISILNKEKILEKQLKETEYFLVGGFEQNKSKGIIKLYKFIKDKNNIKIEYIQDIILDKNNNFKLFNGPISSIIQSKNTGEILITCWDGNVYLFSRPDLNYLLKEINLINSFH